MNTRLITIITAVVALIAIAGVFVFSRSQNTANAAAVPQATGELDLEGQPMLGDADAPVTLVAFEDFECSHCATFEENTFPTIERQFIENGQVKMYFVNHPLPAGPNSVIAANASECALEQSEEAFWDYKTVLYRSQRPGTNWASAANLVSLAEEYVPTLDSEALATCIEEDRHSELVQAERNMGSAAGVQGTPAVFLNGELVADPRGNALVADIEAALANQ